MPICDIDEGLKLRVVGILLILSSYLAGLLEHDDQYTIERENNFHQYDGPVNLKSVKSKYDSWILIRMLYFSIGLYVASILTLPLRKKPLPRIKVSVYKVYFPMSLCLDFLVLILFLESNTTSDLIWIMPFTNIASIYKCYDSEVTFIVRYVVNKLIQFYIRYGRVRVLLFTMFILVHAVLFVLIFKMVGTKCFESVMYLTDSRNFMTSQHCTDLRKFTSIEGKDNASNEIFYTQSLKRYELESSKEKSYSCHQEIKNTEVLTRSGKKLPISHVRYERTLHEDVEFSCRYQYISRGCLNKQETFWSKSDIIFMNDPDKFKVVTQNFETENQWQISESSFLLYDIKEADYGEYQCVRRCWYRDNLDLLVNTVVIGRYHLVRRDKEVNYIHVPLGNTINVQWCPLYFQTEDIKHTHFVDGRSITDSKGNRNGKCSVLPYLYHFLLYHTGWVNIPHPTSIDMQSYPFRLGSDFISVLLNTCADLDVYGIHNISLIREVYNKKTKRTQLVEIENPVQKVILPETPYLYTYDNRTTSDTGYDFKRATVGYTDSDAVVLTIRIIAEALLFFFTIFVIFQGISIAWYTYRRIIIFPIRNLILGDVHKATEGHTFKIAIFCSEEDSSNWDTAALQLIEHMTDSEILFIRRDIEHCAGKRVFKIYSDLFRQANAVIIHLTHSFIEDPECLHLHMYSPLALVTEGQIPPENVLLIHGDGCTLPDGILNFAVPNVVIHDWMQTRGKEEQLHCINKWIIYVKSRARNMDSPNRNTVSSFIL